MKKVLKFVKGKRDDRRERVSPNTALSSSENLHSPTEIMTLGDGIEACDGQKYYLDVSGRDKSVTKLHKAAWQGNLDKVKAVMKKADIDIPDKLNRTPLHLAAACGHNSVVHFLITNNARMDIRDSEGKTPLLKAAECGQKEVVVTLLDRGGDLHSVDFEGNSPLHLSVKNCFYDLSVLLLKKGANFELPNKDGDIPLHVATAVEQIDIVELLLRYGSDVNVLSGDMSPLMIAARVGNTDLLKLFLDYGADCKLKDMNGWTAEDHAQMTSNQSMIPYLQSDSLATLRHGEKYPDPRVDEGIRTLTTFKGPGEKRVKEKEEESNSAAKEASDGNEDNSDTWNDSQVSEKPSNAKIDKAKLQAFLQDSDGDENKLNKGERGQPEGGDTDIGMDTESSGRGNMAGRVDLQDSPKSCPTPPPLKPPRSWDFLQTGVVGCPGNTNSQHQNSKPRQRSLFTMPARDENCDGPKTDTFVEEVIKVSRASSLNESSSIEKSDNGGMSCLEMKEGHSSKSIYESSPRDPWKLRGKAAKERSKEKAKEGIVDIIKENDEEIKQEIYSVVDGAAAALIKEVEDDLVVVYSDASDWESSSGGDGSIGSSDEVDLPMDNLPILVLPENEDESSKPIREEGSRRMSGKLGIAEEEEDDESLSVAALSPATSSVSERRNRFLQRSQSIDLGDEELSTEDETAMENEEEDDVYGMRKKSDGGGTEPSETASREMTTVLEVEGPRLQGKNIPSLGAVGREDTLHGYEEVWESNPQLCPRSCSRGSSSEGPHSPSTPRSPFLEVGFPGRREDRLHPFGRSRSSVGDSDHRSGDEYTSTKANRRRSEESDRRQELINNGYRDCLPKDLSKIPKKPYLSESEGESYSIPSIDIEFSERKNEDMQENDPMQTADVSDKVQDEVFVSLQKTKINMVVEDEETSLNANERKEFKMDVEGECLRDKLISEVQCNAEMSSKTIPAIQMADKANAQTWNVRVDTEMEVEFQMNKDNEKPSLGKGLLKPASRSPPFEESEGEDSVFLDEDEAKDEKKARAQGLVGPLGWGGVSWRVGGATPWRGGVARNLGPLPSSPRSLGENGPEPISLSATEHNSRPHMSSAHSLPSQLSHLALHEEKEDIFNAPINPLNSARNTKDAQTESSTNIKLKETRGYSSLDQAEDPRSKVHTNMVEKNTNKLSVMLSLPRNMEQMNFDEDDVGPKSKSKAEESEDKKPKTEETMRRSLSEMSSQDQLPRTPKRKKTQRSSSLQASHPPETPERSPNRTNPGILKRACSMGKNIIPTKGPQLPPAKDFALLVSTEKDRPQRPSDIKVIEIPCNADTVLSPPILVSPQEYRSMKAEEFRLREDRRSLDDGRTREDIRRKDKARAKLESKSESREETRGRLKRYERIDSSEGKLKEPRRHSGNIREEFMAAVDSERPPKRPPRRHKSLTSESHRSSSPLVKRSLSLSGQASMAAALGQTQRVSQRVVQVEIMAQQQRRRKRRRAALLHPSLDKNDPGAMGGSTEEEDDRRRWETQHRTQSRESAGGSSLRALERRQRLDPTDADGCPSSKESDNSLDGYKVGGSEDEDSESSSEDMDSPAKARALMGRSKEELADGSKREKDRNFNSHSGKVSRGHRVPIAMREQLRASAEERGRLEGEACRLEEQLQTLTWEAEEAREGERAAAALVAALAARVTRLEADTARLAEAGARAKLRIANREQEVMHLREVCMKYEEQKQNLTEIIRLKSIERENLERKLTDREEEEKSRKIETKSNSNELEARLNLLEQERQILEGSNSRLEGELESLRAELEEVRKGVLMGVSSAKAEAEGKVEARLSKELRELQEEVQQWKEKYECSLQVTKEDRNELKKESSSDAEAQVEIPTIEITPIERKDGEAQVNTVGEFDTASAVAADGWRPPLARGKSLPAQTRAFFRDAATNTPSLPAPNAQALSAAKAKELELTKEVIREREKTRKNAHMIKKLRAEIQALKKGMEDAARMAAEAKEEEMKKKIAEMQERNELGAFGDEFGPVSEDVTELRKQVADLESMLSKESSSRESLQNQIGKLMEDLQSMSIANCKLKEEKSNIELELSSALVRLEAEENGWRREVERLGRAHQGEMERARAEARNELSARLSQLNQFLQQQAQEQSRLEKQRMNSEAQLIREFEETKRQLLGEIATLQAALQVKGEEERELRQKCDRLMRENDRREEQRRKRLVERAYSVNFPPAEPIFDLSREKPAPTSVSFSGAPIGGEGLPSPPSPLQSKSHIIPAPPAFLERGKVGMTSSLSLPKPPPVVFLSPPPPGRDALRRELDRSIRKHGRTESLDLEHLRAMAPEKPSTDERLEILRKKYFLP